MSLLTLTRKMIKVAKKIAGPFLCTVDFAPYQSADIYGAVTPGTTVQLKAIVDQSVTEHRTKAGKVLSVKAYVAFLEPLPVNGAAGRTEPIDVRDVITLPDGTTGPIVDISGFTDAGTGHPFFSEVWLGAGTRSNSGGGEDA